MKYWAWIKLKIFLIFMFPLLFFSIDLPAHVSKSEQLIPDSIVSLSSGYAVIVDKETQQLFVFQNSGGNGTFTKVFEAPCSTGKKQGMKMEEGDARTPNGIFFAVKFYNDSNPSPTYGSMAFHLDYPSLLDKRAGRNGSNIWIHGTKKPLKPFNSNGCITLNDHDITQLSKFIYLNKTPIIVEESIKWVKPDHRSSTKDELKNIVPSWSKAIIEDDKNAFESFYFTDAEKTASQKKAVIREMKKLRSLNDHFALKPRDISILKDDNSAVILFDQILAVNNDDSFKGAYVKLFLEKNNDKWFIVEDVPRSLLPARPPMMDARTLVALAKKVTAPPSAKEPPKGETISKTDPSVMRLLEKWVNSWQTGDMANYKACYAPSFKSRGMDLNGWVAYKANLNRKYKNISIFIENIKINTGSEQSAAIFTQYYKASGFKSSGTKKLDLVKINGEWKILREGMAN